MKTVLLIIKEAFSLVCLKMVVRARSLLRDTLSRNAKYHGGFRNNEWNTSRYDFICRHLYKGAAQKKNENLPHISYIMQLSVHNWRYANIPALSSNY